LGKITFPLLSDFYPHGKVTQFYGILRQEGYSERALFIIDKQSVIRYIDIHDIDDQPDNEMLFQELAKVAGVPVPHAITDADVLSASTDIGDISREKPPKVIMYCTNWCPACRRARDYLKQHDIVYEEIDIGSDRKAAERVRGWADGNETTPTFEVWDQVVVNFLRARLNTLLGINE
jgi:glutaredoxin